MHREGFWRPGGAHTLQEDTSGAQTPLSLPPATWPSDLRPSCRLTACRSLRNHCCARPGCGYACPNPGETSPPPRSRRGPSPQTPDLLTYVVRWVERHRLAGR